MNQSSRRVAWLAAMPLAVGLAGGCNPPDPADRPLRPSQVMDLGVLYSQNCAGCHGADGRLGPAPPLNDPLFLAIASDADLRRVVAEGRPGTPMTAFSRASGGGLTDEQVGAIVAGIRSKWGTAATTQSATPLPPYLASAGHATAASGVNVFARNCAVCHGPKGEGASKAGAVNSPAFLALISDQALRRVIITGRPDLGMPDYRHAADGTARQTPLSDQEIADVVALLASWRQSAAQQSGQVAQATGASR